MYFGITAGIVTPNSYVGGWGESLGIQAGGNLYPGGSHLSGCNYTTGDTIGLQVDFSNKSVSIYKNGNFVRETPANFLSKSRDIYAVVSIINNDCISTTRNIRMQNNTKNKTT